jgi:hypothetical protein
VTNLPAKDGDVPTWMTQLIAALDAGLTEQQKTQFHKSLDWASGKWRVLDNAAWARIRLRCLCETIDALKAGAAAVQPDGATYWRTVEDDITQVMKALMGDGSLKEAMCAIEPWSIPEGYDMWTRVQISEGVSDAALRAAKCAADAAYYASFRGDAAPAEVAGCARLSHPANGCAAMGRRLLLVLSHEIAVARS